MTQNIVVWISEHEVPIWIKRFANPLRIPDLNDSRTIISFISIHEMIRDTRSEAPIWIMIRKHWSIIDNIYIQVHLRKLEYGEKVGE